MNHPLTLEDKRRMDNARIERIVAECRFDPWNIVVRYDDKRPYLQVRCSDGVCNVTGERLSWSGRKWMLSPHMVDSEIVRTAWKAVQAAVEHEAAENFKFRGIAIYDPHVDVARLADLISNGGTETRPEQGQAV